MTAAIAIVPTTAPATMPPTGVELPEDVGEEDTLADWVAEDYLFELHDNEETYGTGSARR